MSSHKRAASLELDSLCDALTEYVKQRIAHKVQDLPEMSENDREQLIMKLENAMWSQVIHSGTIELEVVCTEEEAKFVAGYRFCDGIYDTKGWHLLETKWWKEVIQWQKCVEDTRNWLAGVRGAERELSAYDVQYADHRMAIFECIKSVWNVRHPRLPGEWYGGNFIISTE